MLQRKIKLQEANLKVAHRAPKKVKAKGKSKVLINGIAILTIAGIWIGLSTTMVDSIYMEKAILCSIITTSLLGIKLGSATNKNS